MQINYIYRLISLLELEERKQVYRSVTSRGVNVPGFKDINKVPLPILKNILKNKNKNKDYYGILFLKAIVSMNTSAEQIGENVNHDTITPQKIARIILNNEDFEREKINCELYLNNLPTDNLSMTINKGLDYQLSQRVLTKVRGSESQLGSLFHIDSEDGLLKVLEKHSDLSDFYKSKSIINQKRKELDSYGYCI